MSFQDSATSWRSRLHLGRVHPAVLVGALVIVTVVLTCVISGLVNAVGARGFEVVKADDATEEVDAEIVHEAGDVEPTSATSATGASDAGAGDTDAAPTVAPVTQICVHVGGCVMNPGVCYLNEGARVADAVDAAGGFTEAAAPDAINLARVLVDGEQIIVLSFEEAQAASDAAASAAVPAATVDPATTGSAADPAEAAGQATAAGDGKININTADSSQLQTLSGIGEVTAGKIIDYREANGSFSSIEDIKLVSGIGDKKFEAIKDDIYVG